MQDDFTTNHPISTQGYKEELVAKKLARANGGITKAFETKEGWKKILIESFGKVESLEQKEIVVEVLDNAVMNGLIERIQMIHNMAMREYT